MKQQLCNRCGERPAVLFIQKMENDKVVPEGLCIKCARELNIGSINQMIEQLGISDEELEQASEQMNMFMDNMDDFDFGPLGEMFNPENMDGAQTMPFANLFGGENAAGGNADNKQKKPGKRGRKKPQEDTRKFLNNYCNNLTAKAKRGELDAIIGREQELSRTIQILCRRTKNNPCLIGEPGGGKTAIAEGLAIKLAKGEVPAWLLDKEIYLLDLTALVAGTQFRGQFEAESKASLTRLRARAISSSLLTRCTISSARGTAKAR
jgi:ATP-dependent Clp protease ATP-binding subunit ClpA